MKLLSEAEVLERYSLTGYKEMPDRSTLEQLGKMAADPRNGSPLPIDQYLDQLFDNNGSFVAAKRHDGGPIQAGVGLVNHPDEVSAVEFSLVMQNFRSAKERALGRVSLRTRLVEYMLYQHQDSQLAIVEIPANGRHRVRLGYTIEELTRVGDGQSLVICTNGQFKEIDAGTGLKTLPEINLGPGMVSEPVMLLVHNPFAAPYESGSNNYINSILQMRSAMSGLEQEEFLGALADGASPIDPIFRGEEEI